jgi:hypothetical protein
MSERLLSTAASRFALRLSTGGLGQKLLPAVVAAKVERLSTAFGMDSSCFVHSHSAYRVFGLGLRFSHGSFSFAICVGFVIHQHSGNMNARAAPTSSYEEGHLAQAASDQSLEIHPAHAADLLRAIIRRRAPRAGLTMEGHLTQSGQREGSEPGAVFLGGLKGARRQSIVWRDAAR